MRGKLRITSVIILLIGLCFNFSVGEATVDSECGTEISYRMGASYPGEIVIDKVYIKELETDYLITLEYSNGNLVKMKNGSGETVKASFFNPPHGTLVGINWYTDFHRISSRENRIQCRIEKESFKKSETIVVFLYDELYNNSDENLTISFEPSKIDFIQNSQDVEETGQMEFKKDFILETMPSTWAIEPIMNLKKSMLFSNSVFNKDYKSSITRKDFVYILTIGYEVLSGEEAGIDRQIAFKDTSDTAVLKAASVGISNGVGEGYYNPEGLLTREQLAVLLMNMLNKSGVMLESPDEAQLDDHLEISDWAVESVYSAIENGILNGTGQNLFSPQETVTVEMALTVLNRILTKYAEINKIEYVHDVLIKKDDKYYATGTAFYLTEDMQLYTNFGTMQYYIDLYKGIERKHVESPYYNTEKNLYSFEKDFDGYVTQVVEIEDVLNGEGKIIDTFTHLKITYGGKDFLFKYSNNGKQVILSEAPIRKRLISSIFSFEIEYDYYMMYNFKDYCGYFGLEVPYKVVWDNVRMVYILSFGDGGKMDPIVYIN